MQQAATGQVIDTYALREAFGQRARFEKPGMVKAYLRTARRFENILTHYYHEHPKLPENRDVVAKAGRELAKMASYAFAMNAESLVVPVPAESPDAALVGRMVRQHPSLPVRVLLPVR